MFKNAARAAWPAVVLLLLAYSYLDTSPRAFKNAQSREEVQQPQDWVPFAAAVRRARPADPDIFGRFWRNSAGSMREEFDLPSDAKEVAVTIKNVQTSTFYTLLRDGTWTGQPMVLPPGRFRPFRRAAGSAFRRHSSPVLGFEVYAASSTNGPPGIR